MHFPVTAFISPGGGELVLIMLVLILLFGAKDAPRILRSIHVYLDKLQRSAAEFRYKIMYGDLHRDTPDEPYDVDGIEVRNQGSGVRDQESEPKTEELETRNPEHETPKA